MDLNQFLMNRRERWDHLTAILDRIDAKGLASLSPQEADEFFSLYRLVSSDLNLIQTRTGNPALVEYLEGLVSRAYANLAVPHPVRPLQTWWNIVRHRFPAALRSEAKLLWIALLAMGSGALFGFLVCLASPQTAEIFLPAEHLQQSPRERVAELEARERAGQPRISGAGENAAFSAFLFTHNIRVSVLAFALGLTFGVGTVALLFYNGAVLGSITALYISDGVAAFFFGWVGPHGVIELPSVLFAATAGLVLARAQYRRDLGPLLTQLRRSRRKLVDLLVGTSSLLVLAGLIEGGFSQINAPTIPYSVKIGIACVLFAALLAYLIKMPVRAESDQLPRLD